MCFSSKDIDYVKPIADKLRGYGFKVFTSFDNLRKNAGKSYKQIIDSALLNSKHFLFYSTVLSN